MANIIITDFRPERKQSDCIVAEQESRRERKEKVRKMNRARVRGFKIKESNLDFFFYGHNKIISFFFGSSSFWIVVDIQAIPLKYPSTLIPALRPDVCFFGQRGIAFLRTAIFPSQKKSP